MAVTASMCKRGTGVRRRTCTHINQTEAGSLRSNQRTTPASTLSSENSLPFILLGSVGTEQPSYLAWGNTNVSRRYIGVGSDVLGQLAHKGYAELADLVVGFAFGVEVCSSFAASDIHCEERNQ